jgi:hypothetical protein
MLALWIGWLILIELDRRYHDPTFHWPQGISLALVDIGSLSRHADARANSYAAPVVKIQRARPCHGDDRPARRTPMYAGLFWPSRVPLLLGSW